MTRRWWLTAILGLLVLNSCSFLTATTIVGDWKLVTVSGVDWQSYDVIYNFASSGQGLRVSTGGTPQGDAFSYTLGGAKIVITDADLAGLVNAEYDISQSSSTQLVLRTPNTTTVVYVFNKL